jgi:hypothetical protein
MSDSTTIVPTESTDDLLSRHKRELSERLELLRPLIEEYRTLEAALAALDGPPPAPRRRGRPPKSAQ